VSLTATISFCQRKKSLYPYRALTGKKKQQIRQTDGEIYD